MPKNSSLTPVRITDKNGATRTYWVKPEKTSSSSKPQMPVPALAKSPQSEAKNIGDEIKRHFRETDDSDIQNHWTDQDWGHFRALVAERDLVSLRILHELVQGDSPYSPGDVGVVVRELRRKGFDEPADLVNRRTLDARRELINAIDAHGLKDGIPYFSERKGSDDVYLMAFTDTKDVSRICSIILDRGILAPEGIRDVLGQMGEHASSLQQGTL